MSLGSPRSIRRTAIAIVVAGVCAVAQPSIRHVGLTPTDEFLLCARSILKKPIAASTEFYITEQLRGRCGPTRAALDEQLAMAAATLIDGEWIYIDHASRKAPPPFMSVRPKIVDWPEIEGSRRATPDERAAVAAAVFDRARPIPYSFYEHQRLSDVWEPELLIDVHQLRATGAESVISVLWRDGGAAGRMIYGELENGSYQVLWDSPLYDPWKAGMSYEDVDGDGIKEIVVAGRMDRVDKVAILTVEGHEISRDEPCLFEVYADGYTAAGSLCPIVGDRIRFVPVVGAKAVEIHVANAPNADHRNVVYRLVNGRYVRGTGQ